VNADRDAMQRLERLGVPYYVTGSWALAAYAEPRMTRDIDVVLEISRAEYEQRIRPASRMSGWSTTRSTSEVATSAV